MSLDFKNCRRSVRGKIIARNILVAAAIFVTSACAEINHVRDAQDAFNTAALEDNRLRLQAVNTTDAVAESARIRAAYTSVITSIDNISGDDKKKLERDNLWGNVLTMKTIAQWRLGRYDDAEETADDAARSPGQLLPRDRAILDTLPNLIRIDQAFAYYRNPALDAGVYNKWKQNVRQPLKTAMQDLRTHQCSLKGRPDIRVYLAQVEMAAAANLQDSYDTNQPCNMREAPENCGNDRDADMQAIERSLDNLAAKLVEFIRCDAKDDPVLARWERAVGKFANPREFQDCHLPRTTPFGGGG